MFNFLNTNSKPTIDPSKFATGKQETARLARDADEDHADRIKGTSSVSEIKNSFRESIDSWNPMKSKDKVSPDGGMRELARKRGFR